MPKSKTNALLAALLGSTLVSGCALLPTVEFVRTSDAPPALPLVAAAPLPEPPRIIVEELPPVPTRVQTNAVAAAAAAAPVAKASAGLEGAYRGALMTEARASFEGATTLYDYAVGSVYQVAVRPRHITVLAFQPGERIEAALSGDTVRFVIADQSSGDRDYLAIKALQPDVKTNLLVTTDRHEYLIDLISVAETKPFNPRVAWTYPQEFQRAIANRQRLQQQTDARETPVFTDPAKLDFGYEIETVEGKPAWRPLSVFTDNKQTWIQFPPNLGVLEAPLLFTQRAEGPVQVNYRIKNNMFIVDQPLAIGELVLGKDPQDRVRFTRRKGM